jgi:hypothetical protein
LPPLAYSPLLPIDSPARSRRSLYMS